MELDAYALDQDKVDRVKRAILELLRGADYRPSELHVLLSWLANAQFIREAIWQLLDDQSINMPDGLHLRLTLIGDNSDAEVNVNVSVDT